jgi:hypothetical protein
VLREALGESTAQQVAETLLRRTAEALTNPRDPRGCLAVQGALSCGEAADPVRNELNARRAAQEAAIRQRFERAQSEGDLPPGTSAADLARFVATVVQGMAVQAAGGASRDDLRRVVDIALCAWPRRSRRRAAGVAARGEHG